jgi:chromatin remodeling complex protein RSC6
MASTTDMSAVLSAIEALSKDVKSLTKIVRKVRAHQEDPDGEKAKARSANNGFNRKQDVSPKLREFLGLADDELISRSEVTKRINAYVKEQGLKHPDDGRVIIMDDKLTKLLEPPTDTQITFLNIQKFLSPHYIKVEAEQPAETEEKAKPKRPVARKPKA